MATEVDKLHGTQDAQRNDPLEQKLHDSGRNDPAADDAKRFSDAMGTGKKGKAADDRKKFSNAFQLPVDVQCDIGESLCVIPLAGAFQATAAAQSLAVPKQIDGVNRRDLIEIIDKIVGLILTSDASLSAGKKVHMQLKDSALVGTSVQITKTGNSLQVSFSTTNAMQTELIDKNQNALRVALLGQTKANDVKITVNGDENNANFPGGSGGRSKGEYFSGEEPDGEESREDSIWRGFPTSRGRI